MLRGSVSAPVGAQPPVEVSVAGVFGQRASVAVSRGSTKGVAVGSNDVTTGTVPHEVAAGAYTTPFIVRLPPHESVPLVLMSAGRAAVSDTVREPVMSKRRSAWMMNGNSKANTASMTRVLPRS